LARLAAAYAPREGRFAMRIPGLRVTRFSRINQECVHALRLPCLSIIAQGAKRVIVGQETYEYDSARMLVYSVALPVAAQVTQASASEPYLALRLDLDPLHYQKVPRLLQEARRLVLSAMMDASNAGRRVGYLSASQFSREYSRFYGSAPSKDIAKLRNDDRAWSTA
jgi:hypothetical protein